MPANTPASNTCWFATAIAVASALVAASAAASDHKVIEALHVSKAGLDLGQPADARTFYTRLQNAAWVVCTRGDRADLVPVDNPKRCYDDALAGAVRAARQPLITQLYLGSHTLEEAAAHGIDVSVVAAR